MHHFNHFINTTDVSHVYDIRLLNEYVQKSNTQTFKQATNNDIVTFQCRQIWRS